MKKALILCYLLLMCSSHLFAQIGIGTDQPRGVLDINNPTTQTNLHGLVLPMNDPTLITNPQGGEIAIGTLIFDTQKNCVKVFTGTLWSECMRGIDEDEEWIHEHVVRWGYGNWDFGIGHLPSSEKFVKDLLDVSLFGHNGIYDKVPAIELREITEQQLAKPEYIRYRFDVISVDATSLQKDAIKMLIDFAEHGGSVIINLNQHVDPNPLNPIFTELGFRNTQNISGNTTATNNISIGWNPPISTLFGPIGSTYGMGAGGFVNIPLPSLPLNSIVLGTTPNNNAAIWTCGPGNRILILHTNRLFGNQYYNSDINNSISILMKNLTVNMIDRTLENRSQ